MKTQILFYLLLLPCLAFAQPQQSENFRIAKSVLDASGGAAASEDFHLVSTVGQPSPLGTQSSAYFTLYPGYLAPEFAVASFSPIQNLVIQWVDGTSHMQLAWPPVAGANSYYIYRDSTVSFTPSESNRIGMMTDAYFVDENALLLTPVKYYYCVTASTDIPPALTVKSGTQTAAPVVKESSKLGN